jgi:hypothetical protein
VSRRRVLVVVSDAADRVDFPQDGVVFADEYLAGPPGYAERDTVVVNLCRSYRYRTKGYYVSLLADARGQQVLPAVETLEGLSDSYGLFRSLAEAGIPTVSAVEMRSRRRALPAEQSARGEGTGGRGGGALPPLVREQSETGPVYRAASPAEMAETTLVLGTSADPRFEEIGKAVYRERPVPILSLELLREDDTWKVIHVSPVPLPQVDPEARGRLCALREETRASIAVLVDPEDMFSPSTPETIERLERVASRLNVHVRRIGLDDLAKLGEYDALFIRALTGVREPPSSSRCAPRRWACR